MARDDAPESPRLWLKGGSCATCTVWLKRLRGMLHLVGGLHFRHDESDFRICVLWPGPLAEPDNLPVLGPSPTSPTKMFTSTKPHSALNVGSPGVAGSGVGKEHEPSWETTLKRTKIRMDRGRICSLETVAMKREPGESRACLVFLPFFFPLRLLMFIFSSFSSPSLSFCFCCCTRWSLSGKTQEAHWVGNLVQSAI